MLPIVKHSVKGIFHDKTFYNYIPLYSHKFNKKMSRDIVQFVPFEEFKNDAYKLAKETTWKIYNMLQKLLIKTPKEKMHIVKIIK